MIINRHRKHNFCAFLANYIIIQRCFDLMRDRQAIRTLLGSRLLHLFPDNVITQINTLITDEHRRACNQLADFVLTLATKRAVKQLSVISTLTVFIVGHWISYNFYRSPAHPERLNLPTKYLSKILAPSLRIKHSKEQKNIKYLLPFHDF